MTEEEFQLFNELLSDRYGLYFPQSKIEILEARLRPRLQYLKLRRFIDYYFLLQFNSNGESEIFNVARLVTNNETYFFRETHQFETLFNYAVDDLKIRCGSAKTFRFLCAGCSSGEEPYTLNIYAKENQYRLLGYSIEIDAFDIDTDAIQFAKKAAYNSNSLRFTEREKIDRYFKKDDKHYILKDIFRGGIVFDFGNILKVDTYQKPLPYDVIFCRNVLIYFSESALRKAIENFARCLRPEGLLFLGHAESIIGISKCFETTRLGNSIIYKRVIS
jgi:chemotaxis protein methyltransferase CheR